MESKKIRWILHALAAMICVLCMWSMCEKVEAATILEPDEEAGNNVYFFDFVSWSTVMSDPSGYYDGCIGYGSATFEGYKVCGYKYVVDDEDNKYDRCWIELYVYNDNGYYSKGSGLTGLVSDYAASSVGSVTYGFFNSETLKFDYESSKNPTTTYTSLVGNLYWRQVSDYQFHDVAKLITNVPIFSSQEQAIAFMSGDGSVTEKDALNYYTDILDLQFDSSDVPVPRNYGVIKEDDRYYLYWEQTSKENEKITNPVIGGEIFNYTICKTDLVLSDDGTYVYDSDDGDPSLLYAFQGEDFDILEQQALSKQLVYKIDITDDINNVLDWAQNQFDYMQKCLPDVKIDRYNYYFNLDYMLMNRYEDSDNNVIKFSNGLVANVDISSSSDGGIKISVDTVEVDSSGKEVPDSPYNEVENDLGDGSFIGSITNGFGLLGDSGLISLLKSCMSFMPSEFWLLLLSGVSAVIIVGIFKLFLR